MNELVAIMVDQLFESVEPRSQILSEAIMEGGSHHTAVMHATCMPGQQSTLLDPHAQFIRAAPTLHHAHVPPPLCPNSSICVVTPVEPMHQHHMPPMLVGMLDAELDRIVATHPEALLDVLPTTQVECNAAPHLVERILLALEKEAERRCAVLPAL